MDRSEVTEHGKSDSIEIVFRDVKMGERRSLEGQTSNISAEGIETKFQLLKHGKICDFRRNRSTELAARAEELCEGDTKRSETSRNRGDGVVAHIQNLHLVHGSTRSRPQCGDLIVVELQILDRCTIPASTHRSRNGVMGEVNQVGIHISSDGRNCSANVVERGIKALHSGEGS